MSTKDIDLDKRVIRAAAWAKSGFAVFPSNKEGLPIKDWPNRATNNFKKVQNYYVEHPEEQVCAALGEPSKAWALDLDVKNGVDGIKELKKLEAELGESIPETLAQTTPSGGKHLIFRLTDDCNFRNSVGKLAPGIDVRTTGGFIRVAPTEGYSKQGALTKLAEAPSWLINRLNALSGGQRATNKEAKRMAEKDVKWYLEQLNPEDYRDRDKWVELMAMCSHASAGEEWGMDLFTEFSLRDDFPYSRDPVLYIEEMWPTIKPDKDNGLTCSSLVYELSKKKRQAQADAFGDEGQDIQPTSKKSKGPQYEEDSLVDCEEGDPDSHWSVTINAKGHSHVKENACNLIQLLTKKKLHSALGAGKNPLCDLIGFNQLQVAPVYRRKPPWALRDADPDYYEDLALQKSDDTELQALLERDYDLRFSTSTIRDGILAASMRRQFHPVREWLDSLKWDGKPRLEQWLQTCGGVKNSLYTRAVGKKMWLSMVARCYQPGCKVDTIPVLEGPQGIGKSTMMELIGGAHYANPEIPIGNKDAEQNIAGKILVEWAEWATNKKEDNLFRAFASKRVSRFRASYGERAQDFPRTCVIWITINPDSDGTYLTDPTGHRRIWPIEFTCKIDLQWIQDNRDQLFAEAVHFYKSGEIWHLTNEEEASAAIETDKRRVVDEWEPTIREYLYEGEGKDLPHIAPMDIAKKVLRLLVKDMSGGLQRRRICNCLRNMGWTKGSIRDRCRVVTTVWKRPENL